MSDESRKAFEKDFRVERLLRCGDGYDDMVVHLCWVSWNDALKYRDAQLAAANARVAELEADAKRFHELDLDLNRLSMGAYRALHQNNQWILDIAKCRDEAQTRLATIAAEVGPENDGCRHQFFVMCDGCKAIHYKHRAEQLAAKVARLKCCEWVSTAPIMEGLWTTECGRNYKDEAKVDRTNCPGCRRPILLVEQIDQQAGGEQP